MAKRTTNPTIDLLHGRASCRNFLRKPIPRRVLRQVLEAGTHAPTGGNLQPYSIIQIENRATSERLGRMCAQPFIGRAPTNLLFCLDLRRNRRWAEAETAPYTAEHSFLHFWVSFQDTVICAQNICTAADALGLGSVYIGTVTGLMDEVGKMFRLPDGVLPVVLLCLGYPARRPAPRSKLGVDTVVHRERYRDLPVRELRAAYEAKYPGFALEATGERLKRLERVCRKAHGVAFAKKCLGAVKKRGSISKAQHVYGLHYDADQMPACNRELIEMVEGFGFGFFRKWRPRRKKED